MQEYHVLNLGAGVQSTCLFLLAREPEATLHFDVAILADTGEEPDAVYKHLDYLRSLGQPEIWVRSAGKLGDDLIHGVNSTGQRFASIPAFTLCADAGKAAKPIVRASNKVRIHSVRIGISLTLAPLGCREQGRAGINQFLGPLLSGEHQITVICQGE